MAIRIRYENYDDQKGVYDLVSVRNFYSNKHFDTEEIKENKEAMYIVYLDTKNMNYRIKNIFRETSMFGGDGISNLHVLKRKVKERLESVGVSFDSEIRDNSSRIVGENCGYNKKEE